MSKIPFGAANLLHRIASFRINPLTANKGSQILQKCTNSSLSSNPFRKSHLSFQKKSRFSTSGYIFNNQELQNHQEKQKIAQEETKEYKVSESEPGEASQSQSDTEILAASGSGEGEQLPVDPLLDDNMEPEFVVKLRGLPWSATADDILEFIGDNCNVRDGTDGIHLILADNGRASGEAFVDLLTDQDIEEAVKRDHQNMGHRYIEVFKVKRAEMNWVLRRTGRPNQMTQNDYDDSPMDAADFFVRLRGLPYECTKNDIAQFFSGLDPCGIFLLTDNMGRNSGEAYAKFNTKESTEKALQRDRQCLGHRYLEIFRVGPAELRSIDMLVARSQQRPSFPSNNRPSPYDRGMGGPMGRFGGRGDGPMMGMGRPSRYFNKGGYEDNNWNNYANEVGSGWGGGGGGGRVFRGSAPPPPPPPLMPRFKGGRSGGPPPQNNTQRMNMGNNGSNMNNGNVILMRGIPFKATEDDIRSFFEPLNPSGVLILFEDSGRPSGNAKVQFNSAEEMTQAMGKHKERMQHRYIELFTM